MKKVFCLLGLMATRYACFRLLLTLQANVITVPTDYSTIQTAINNAASGDTIQVLPGTYAGNIQITKSITLRGDPGDARCSRPWPERPCDRRRGCGRRRVRPRGRGLQRDDFRLRDPEPPRQRLDERFGRRGAGIAPEHSEHHGEPQLVPRHRYGSWPAMTAAAPNMRSAHTPAGPSPTTCSRGSTRSALNLPTLPTPTSVTMSFTSDPFVTPMSSDRSECLAGSTSAKSDLTMAGTSSTGRRLSTRQSICTHMTTWLQTRTLTACLF